ncbi:MAG: BspA family leucine-rich repeat surface protein [Eubacterium sp.]|nr:BspA family leucine-rich repeat surface protein [Eubacterium sp.]
MRRKGRIIAVAALAAALVFAGAGLSSKAVFADSTPTDADGFIGQENADKLGLGEVPYIGTLDDRFEYEVDEENQWIFITKVKDDSITELDIPSVYNPYEDMHYDILDMHLCFKPGTDWNNVTSVKVNENAYISIGDGTGRVFPENVESVTINDAYAIGESLNGLFEGYKKLTQVAINNFDVSSVKDMSFMFAGCDNLRRIGPDRSSTSSFIGTEQVENLSSMFQGCAELEYTTVVSNGISITENFKESPIKNLSYYADGCRNIDGSSILIKSLNTAEVKDFSYMFRGCTGIGPKINLADYENFKLDNAENMKGMYSGCTGIGSITFPSSGMDNVTDMSEMFSGCTKLSALTLPTSFTGKNVTNMSHMFFKCSSLKDFGFFSKPSLDTSKVTDMSYMFGTDTTGNMVQPEGLDLQYFDTENVVNMEGMFRYCRPSKPVNLESFDTSSVTNMKEMFHGSSLHKMMGYQLFNTSSVTTMREMFAYAIMSEENKEIDISGYNTSSVTDMGSMFEDVHATITGLGDFDTSSVTDMSDMFYGYVPGDENGLDLSSFDTSSVTDMTAMFESCDMDMIKGYDKFDTSSVTRMYAMFAWTRGTLLLSGYNTSNVREMNYMFNGYEGTEIDVSHFDTSSVEDMTGMFSDCPNLKKLILTNFNTSSLKRAYGMFMASSQLYYLDISSFDMTHIEPKDEDSSHENYDLFGDGTEESYLPEWAFIQKEDGTTYLYVYAGIEADVNELNLVYGFGVSPGFIKTPSKLGSANIKLPDRKKSEYKYEDTVTVSWYQYKRYRVDEGNINYYDASSNIHTTIDMADTLLTRFNPTFADVDPLSAGAEQIYQMCDKKITGGFRKDGKVEFRPNQSVTRAQFAIFLYNLALSRGIVITELDTTPTTEFTDVKEGDSGYKQIIWASNKGIISGFPNGTFKPNNNISRAQIALMLNNFQNIYYTKQVYERSEEMAAKYPDYDSMQDRFQGSVTWVLDWGIMSGKSKKGQLVIAPNDSATRAQVAIFLMRYDDMI